MHVERKRRGMEGEERGVGVTSSKCAGTLRLSEAKMRLNMSCRCSGGSVSNSTRCRAITLRWTCHVTQQYNIAKHNKTAKDKVGRRHGENGLGGGGKRKGRGRGGVLHLLEVFTLALEAIPVNLMQ